MIFKNNWNKYVLILVLIYVAIVRGFLLTYFNNGKEEQINMLRTVMDNGSELDLHFKYVVYIFDTLASVGVNIDLFSMILSLFILYILFDRFEKCDFYLYISVFFILPAPFLYLGVISKELILISSLTVCLFLEKKHKLSSLMLILAYSIFFRLYFLSFVLGRVSSSLSTRIKLLFVFVFSLVLILIYDHVSFYIFQLMDRRDDFYYYWGSIVRTSWENPFKNHDMVSFFMNYLYSFFRLNFSTFFSFDVKSIFLQIYVVVFLYSIVITRSKSYMIGVLFMFFTYPLFEPDLGSYLRHLSSLFPCLIFNLATLQKEKIDENNSCG